jgi:hypothetical protein
MRASFYPFSPPHVVGVWSHHWVKYPLPENEQGLVGNRPSQTIAGEW